MLQQQVCSRNSKLLLLSLQLLPLLLLFLLLPRFFIVAQEKVQTALSPRARSRIWQIWCAPIFGTSSAKQRFYSFFCFNSVVFAGVQLDQQGGMHGMQLVNPPGFGIPKNMDTYSKSFSTSLSPPITRSPSPSLFSIPPLPAPLAARMIITGISWATHICCRH